ncbi:hypothetical protein PSTG_12805 [Puccinia striiformis f. sp. tritici PST-78]|uniref:HAT C-terminal dimerisation domain-containing protein n=1 Tax=Puccinia striiformis f. sp. tritici PST-78 TaxID=1165861 RepID=A0A0L0V3P2_9BASI|nr:hypothetical protein PSTG_12805 [Puccinia striiformis f. sp. tritici PST-78]
MWLYTRTWAATKAHRLYLNLQARVVTTLQNLTSKYTLIHNYIASNHKGQLLAIPFANILSKFKLEDEITQTTDSGSNNFTKATEVNQLIQKKKRESVSTSRKTTSGLHALHLASDELIDSCKNTLGFVPGLALIDEESNGVEPDETYVTEDAELGDNPLEAVESDDEEHNTEQFLDDQTCSIDRILKKVDFIIQRITSSSAKQFEYTTWSETLKISGPSLIAGYGIRWNVEFQSRKCGYEGHMVIAKLIELEKGQQKIEGGQNYYSNLDITTSKWEVVNQLNEILSEFYFLTKKMEGDYSSGSVILSEYHQMKDFMNTKLGTAGDLDLKAMLRKMLTKTNSYLNEALECDAILIAMALNLCFQLSIFQAWFPSYYTYIKDLLQNLFKNKKAEIDATKETAPAPEKKKKDRSKQALDQDFDVFADAVEAPMADKLTLSSDQVSNSLDWWKDHCQEFPILALLARDYLACCVTSASAERCLSAAADTCSQDRGSLAARTIERSVSCSSHQWLTQGIKPDGDFETAQERISHAEHQKTKEKANKAMIEMAKE